MFKAIVVVFVLLPTLAHADKFYDKSGALQGYTEHNGTQGRIDVYDKNHQHLGYSEPYGSNGVRYYNNKNELQGTSHK